MATLVIPRVRSWGAHGFCASRRGGKLRAVAIAAFAFAAGCTHVPRGRYAVDDLDIEGTSKVDSSDVEEKIATAETPRFLGLFRGIVLEYELFDRYILERDLERIERYYRARGYYEAHARAGRVEKIDDVSCTGERRRRGGARRHGGGYQDQRHRDPSHRRRGGGAGRRPATPARGASFRRGTLRDVRKSSSCARSPIADTPLPRSRGASRSTSSHHVADVFLDVKAGQPAKLGAVTINGLGPLPEAPVRRALDLADGELYSTAKLESAKLAILALGVFSEAVFEPDLSRPGSPVVPITVT